MNQNFSQEFPAQGLTLAAARSEGSPQVANLFRRPQLRGAVADFTMFSLRGKPVSISVEGIVYRNNGKPTAAERFVEVYFKKTLVAMGYCKSQFLGHMPGGVEAT